MKKEFFPDWLLPLLKKYLNDSNTFALQSLVGLTKIYFIDLSHLGEDIKSNWSQVLELGLSSTNCKDFLKNLYYQLPIEKCESWKSEMIDKFLQKEIAEFSKSVDQFKQNTNLLKIFIGDNKNQRKLAIISFLFLFFY